MKHWETREDGFATKAEKLKPLETKLMIQLIKDISNLKSLLTGL